MYEQPTHENFKPHNSAVAMGSCSGSKAYRKALSRKDYE